MAAQFEGPDPIARDIFTGYFESVMKPDDYRRALGIFDEVGNHNERSVAIQFVTAQAFEKLPEVLEVYERLINPETNYLPPGMDPIMRIVEVKLFGDMVYGSVIAEGNPIRLLEKEVDIPDIFDAMNHSDL